MLENCSKKKLCIKLFIKTAHDLKEDCDYIYVLRLTLIHPAQNGAKTGLLNCPIVQRLLHHNTAVRKREGGGEMTIKSNSSPPNVNKLVLTLVRAIE